MISLEMTPDGIVVRLGQAWEVEKIGGVWADVRRVFSAHTGQKKVIFQADELAYTAPTLPAFLLEVEGLAQFLGYEIQDEGLPVALKRLLALARATPEAIIEKPPRLTFWLERLGAWGWAYWKGIDRALAFVGELSISLFLGLKGKRLFRARDFWLMIERCGANALPIVTLISFLVGLTMAFVGALQLQLFGASIYVANLVGLAMVREMGAMMVGIILCGRTGAAFASEIGSMKVAEELDAFKTFGISIIDFIVTPRVLALFLMTPLLCLYANFIGVLGGMVASMCVLDVGWYAYLLQTQKTITLTNLSTGLIKSTVFGALVALTGCFRGIECGYNASSIGKAATSAVVTGITSIVIADALFAVIFHVLDM